MKVCPRDGTTFEGRRCPECHRRQAREWRAAHIETCRARDRARYADPAKGRREQSRAGAQRWRLRHPERSKVTSLRNRWSHIDRVREASRRWQRENRSAATEAQRRRRARLIGADAGDVTTEALQRLLIEQQNTCAYCGDDLTAGRHLEHKTPLVRGGAHSLENVCWACPDCNRRKGTQTAEEFMAAEAA